MTALERTSSSGEGFVNPDIHGGPLRMHLVSPHNPSEEFSNPFVDTARENLARRSFLSDPIMGKKLLTRYETLANRWKENPTSQTKAEIKKTLGDLGVFLYLRGMPVYMHIRDKDNKIIGTELDTDQAPSVRMGPNTSLQLLEAAKITRDDIVGELFSGVGGLTIPTALRKPHALYAIDRYTPGGYDLKRTFTESMKDVLDDIDPEFRPEYTTPTFVQKDARELERSEIPFTVVLGDPPYGREYANIFPDMPESDGFRIWAQALASLTEPGVTQKIRAFTVVPIEWVQTLRASIDQNFNFKEAYTYLNYLLHENKYYENIQERIKESTRPKTFGWGEMVHRIANFDYKKVEETSRFELAIVHHKL